jgi:hypothetical protein
LPQLSVGSQLGCLFIKDGAQVPQGVIDRPANDGFAAMDPVLEVEATTSRTLDLEWAVRCRFPG